MKKIVHAKVKAAESNTRMAAVRRARKNTRVAVALQRRASLVGAGARWRITNFGDVAQAMAQWA